MHGKFNAILEFLLWWNPGLGYAYASHSLLCLVFAFPYFCVLTGLVNFLDKVTQKCGFCVFFYKDLEKKNMIIMDTAIRQIVIEN